MPNYLTGAYQPKQVDLVDAVGRGMQLGRNIGTIPLQNALVNEQMRQMEQLNQTRNAMTEYGLTGDVTPLMKVNPEKAFAIQDSKTSLELKKAGVLEKSIAAGTAAIVKLAPMINETNYPEIKKTVDKIFGANVMPDVYDANQIKRIAMFAGRYGKNDGMLNVSPGGAVYDPLNRQEVYRNPLQARPMDPTAVDLKRRELDIKDEANTTTIPGATDGPTGLPLGPDKKMKGRVSWAPQSKSNAPAGTVGKLMADWQLLYPGKTPTEQDLVNFKNLFTDNTGKSRNAADIAAGIVKYQDFYVDENDPVKAEKAKKEKREQALRDTTALVAELQKQYGGKAPTNALAPKKNSGTPPLNKLVEGSNTTFTDGQTWTLKNGKPVRIP